MWPGAAVGVVKVWHAGLRGTEGAWAGLQACKEDTTLRSLRWNGRITVVVYRLFMAESSMSVLQTDLIEMLRVDLPETAGGRLTERRGPACAQAGARVGPWPVRGRDLNGQTGWRAARGPAESRRLAQSLLGGNWCDAGVRGLTGYLREIEVLFSL